jgi:predicted NACHT family NTPase
MDEVIEDLQLMLDRPSKFLRGSYDTMRQSFSGLQLQETFMPRDNEFAEIQSCYRRSILGPSEVTVVSGESGSGKTWLCQRVGRFITAETGVFLSGKFDQMEQSKPVSSYKIIAHSLANY